MSHTVTAGPTTQSALTAGAAVAYDPANSSPTVIRVGSNRAFHVLVSRAGTVATATNSMIVMSGCEFVRVNVGETVSVIAATSETEGVVTFTPQREEG